MPAIITDDLKFRVSEFLFKNVSGTDAVNSGDSASYYIGIGKADTYDSSDTVSTPIRTNFEEQEARSNLMSMKKVINKSYVIPRYNWTSGNTYSAWSDATVGVPSNTFYVLTEDNEVYICIQKGIDGTGNTNQSTVKPSYTDAAASNPSLKISDIFQTADGYRWKFAYSLSASRASTFLTSGFIPIEDVKSITGTLNAFQIQQQTVEANADSGAIVGVRIISQGSGYATPTVPITFIGDGHSASATATVSGNKIVKVEMNDSNNAIGHGGGRDYSFASAKFTGNATLEPILSSKNGLGSNLLRDLKCSSVMFNVKATGDEGNTFPIGQDFRQISLIRNPLDTSGVRLDQTSYKVGRFIDLTASLAGSFSSDDVITDTVNGVTAHVVEVDTNGSGNTRLRFIQNQNHVIGKFGANNNLSPTGTIAATGDSAGHVDIYSGDLMYLENRTKVDRTASQSEDIKIVLTV